MCGANIKKDLSDFDFVQVSNNFFLLIISNHCHFFLLWVYPLQFSSVDFNENARSSPAVKALTASNAIQAAPP